MSKINHLLSRIVAEVAVAGKELYFESKLKKASSPFFKNRMIVWLLGLNLVALIFGFFYIFLELKDREELIPLHYNIYFGVDLIGNKDEVFKLPLIGAVIFLINYFLAGLVYRSEKFAAYILAFASLGVSIILGLAGIFILNI